MRIKGDFKDDDGSYSDRVGKVIGGLNPAGDVRDIVADGKRVWDGEKGGWIKLGATIIGAVPVVGDAGKALIKTEEKAIIKGLEKSAEKEIVEVSEKEVAKIAKEEAAEITKTEVKSVFPRGYENVEQFNKSASDIKNSLKVDDATIGVRGSSVAGLKFKSGEAFDASSDIDFLVVSDKLYAQGIEKGAKGSNGAFKVGATRKYFSEIHETEKILSQQLGRKATIRIFNEEGFKAIKTGQEILAR